MQNRKATRLDAFSYVYNLITVFAVRSPALRQAALRAETHMTRVIMNMLTSSEPIYEHHLKKAKQDGCIQPDLHVPFEKMRDFVKTEAHEISIPAQRHINAEFSVFQKISDKVAQRYWSVLIVNPAYPI